jgi:hypothetical protein
MPRRDAPTRARTRGNRSATKARDARTDVGTFTAGNRGGAQIVLLDGFDPQSAAPWFRPTLARAQTRFRGMKTSGLFKRCGTRLDGLLRAACVADATHEALTAHAATLTSVAEARAVLADARSAAREARTAWLRLFALVGHTKNSKGASDPLGALARELGDEDEGSTDHD